MSIQRCTARLIARHRLCDRAIEVRLSRPEGFVFEPGQVIRIRIDGQERDYSLINGPDDPHLAICVAKVPGGRVSGALGHMALGTEIAMEGPIGYFVFYPSSRTPIFVATGTGVAPFVAMARAGVRGFVLLHGVRRAEDLYYAGELARAAARHVACLTDPAPPPATIADGFAGRVTAFIENRLTPDVYDFYLCGRADMIRDAMVLIDTRFGQSRVFIETFWDGR